MAKAKTPSDDEDLIGGDDAGSAGDGRPLGRGDNQRGGVAGKQLRAFVERVERLEEEKKGIADDIKDVMAEAKGNGFDTKALRQIIRERKQDPGSRQEFESICDLYRHALGMLPE